MSFRTRRLAVSVSTQHVPTSLSQPQTLVNSSETICDIYIGSKTDIFYLRVWDTRMLETLSGRTLRSAPNSVGSASPRSPSKSKSRGPSSMLGAPNLVDKVAVDKLLETKHGQTTMRARWLHGKSVSSAYWDPRGRSIVSTSYDDTIRSEYSSEVIAIVLKI